MLKRILITLINFLLQRIDDYNETFKKYQI